MISLSQIESNLKDALKARNSLKADVLRGLKTRIQNEQIAKTRELEEAEILALVRSEVKRRKEAAAAYGQGNRTELAEKELSEARILEEFLPARLPEGQISAGLDQIIAQGSFTAKDFGRAMGAAKSKFGEAADGAVLARLLKEKLTNNS